MNFYQHHIGDYAKDTAHLSMLEDAAYRRMLDVYYGTEKPLPKNQQAIYRLVRARSHPEKLAVDIVLGEFFTEADDGWHNKRADEEIAKALEQGLDAQAKREHELDRQRRHRARRGELFAELRALGIVPKWDTTMEELEQLLVTHRSRTGHAPVTRDKPSPETDLQRLTNTQYPVPNKTLTTASAVVVPDGTPECPHEKLISVYHELLPTCPAVAEWGDTRQKLMRSRWREKSKPNGRSQGYTTQEDGLVYWRRFFDYVSQSKFLTGNGDPKQGRPPFVASLEWLLKPSNFAKVVEGNFHR